jgi:hypothetical protein
MGNSRSVVMENAIDLICIEQAIPLNGDEDIEIIELVGTFPFSSPFALQ